MGKLSLQKENEWQVIIIELKISTENKTVNLNEKYYIKYKYCCTSLELDNKYIYNN
jgi:hypothetical protein